MTKSNGTTKDHEKPRRTRKTVWKSMSWRVVCVWHYVSCRSGLLPSVSEICLSEAVARRVETGAQRRLLSEILLCWDQAPNLPVTAQNGR